jgi:hypothetical protein
MKRKADYVWIVRIGICLGGERLLIETMSAFLCIHAVSKTYAVDFEDSVVSVSVFAIEKPADEVHGLGSGGDGRGIQCVGFSKSFSHS